MSARKIVRLTWAPMPDQRETCLYAVADDGTAWARRRGTESWTQVDALPTTEQAPSYVYENVEEAP